MKEQSEALRRLHAENERLHQINHAHEMKLSVRGYEIQIEDLKAVNQELLEALQAMLRMTERHATPGLIAAPGSPVALARAAIARAEGEKT